MGLFKLAIAVEAARRLAAMAVDKRGLRSLEKIAFGMSDRGGIGAADDIEEHILQHVVEIGGRHEPPEIFPEQGKVRPERSEEHTSELQSLMRSSYADFCLKIKNKS